MEQVERNRELRVLMLEDMPTDAELAERELRKAGIAFTSICVQTRDAFTRALEEFRPDIVLSDYSLPDFNGMAALELVQLKHPEIPVIMVTGALADIEAVELIHAGAKDYVLKDRLARLAPAVQRALAVEHGLRARKAAEKALRESEAKFRALVETTSDWIWEINEQAVYTYASPQVHELLGYTVEEVIGKTPFDLMAPDQSAQIKAPFNAILAAKKPFRLWENAHLYKDGRVVFLETSGDPMFDVQGVFKGYRGIDRDITERKRVEQALAQKERYYRKMLEGGSDVIFVMDHAGTVLYRSESGKQMTGWEAAEVLGQPVTDFVPAQALPLVQQAMAEVLRNPTQWHRVEFPLLRKDGLQVEVEALARNLLDDLDVHGIVVTLRDIGERKRGELALARASRALRTLSACNEALVRAATEPELLDSICRLIVETGGYRMAWVGFAEQDPAKTVRPVAHYGYDEGYLAAANISWADIEQGCGPTGTAIRTGTVQVNQNLLSNPAMAPWREAAQKRSYQSSMALPLKNFVSTLGVLTIYSSEPGAFNEAEVALLKELAEDLAFGIETLRTHVDRDRIANEQKRHAEVLRRSLEDSIKAIADTVEMRDPYTAGHQRRVGQLAVAIARELGLPEEISRGIELAASIHDLGKISIPAEILVKPAKLTGIEMMLLKNHARAGFDILKDIQFPWPIASMVLQHHERLDGTGYPQGLKGEQILTESRIIAVADVVEAMASHRPYRAALGIDVALEEIERGRGTAYDAAVVDACVRLFTEKRFVFSI